MIDQKAIRKAITWFEEQRDGYEEARKRAVANGAMSNTIKSAENIKMQIQVALACLRECAERREGCEWCTPELNERVKFIFSRIGHTSWGDYASAGRVDGTALCCPNCGRKLERSDT